MARYTGPKTKIARKFHEPIYGPDKSYEKKPYAPGMHGQNRRPNTPTAFLSASSANFTPKLPVAVASPVRSS